jgi:asparagine synthase (glutamine-hydrolysing)
MCGITGYYALQQEAVAGISKVKQSTDKLFLRGPDCGNVIYDEKVALGHRRLSIIDTSHAADQPMKDVSGRYVIVFNGEIFNYKQLSEKYLSAVWQRIGGAKTTSDTEVLLYLLIEYGVECLGWLGGFFAFAFYDTETEQLLLARDRYGKKPLLLYADESQVAFASEMKALLEWGIPKNIDYTVLHQYFQLNYIPQPQSIFKNVQKLAPGHYVSITPGGITKPVGYYDIKIDRDAYDRYSYAEAKQILAQKMDAAVQDRMIADVPLGAFLSGGIDSSVVVALASRYTKQLNTFSVGYKNNSYFDETKYAQLVAKKYDTNHTVFSLSNNDFLEHVYAVLDYIDEPFADSSAIPVYILCKHTRKHVTVSLSGDGGDEVFAGYNKHGAEWKMRQASWVNQLVKAGGPLWDILPKGRNGKLTNLFRQLHRFAEGAQLSAQERYWRWASIRNRRDVDELFSDETKGMVNVEKMKAERTKLLQCIHTEDFNEVLLADMKLVLPGDMLVKVDLMSMANSLEVRSPFLDKDVVDFAFSLPSSYKIDATLKKRIVQDAFRDMLPEEIYNRPKHGFEIPLLDWFRKELWGLINEDLLQADFVKEQGIFNVATIEELKKKLQSNNPGDSHATIWALIVFQYWWRKHMS